MSVALGIILTGAYALYSERKSCYNTYVRSITIFPNDRFAKAYSNRNVIYFLLCCRHYRQVSSPRASMTAPVFTQKLHNITPAGSQTIRLQCRAIGSPKPAVSFIPHKSHQCFFCKATICADIKMWIKVGRGWPQWRVGL